MLTFLFALAAIWTLYWLVMYLLHSSESTAFSNSKVLCSTCAHAASGSSIKTGAASSDVAANTASKSGNNANSGAQASNYADEAARAKLAADARAKADRDEETANQVKAAREQARAEAASQANAQTKQNVVKTPVADKHDQSNVKPLFVAPNNKDDLKVIKGIGVVMEKTLNDLGIQTFKQLAGFQQADVKMVSEALDASNSGFGDRIERDEWVGQAKILAQ